MAKSDLKSRISAWRNGSEGFFKWIADTKPMIPSEKGGYEPYTVPNEEVREAIRQALDGSFSTVVLCWPRRHGKTVVSALIVVWRFLTRRTQTVAIVANSERQSVDTAFKLARTIIEQTPYSKLLVDEGSIKIGADSITYGALANVIQGYPANAASLYGKKLSVAQVSELHAARTDTVYQTLASSTIDTDDGLVLVDSTTGSRSSPLFTLAQVAERGTDPSLLFSHIQYRDLEDAIARGPRWIAPAKLRSRSVQMLPAEFSQQHLNQWTAASSSLFPAEIIEKCRESYAIDVPTLVNGAAFAVGGALDRAYGFSLHGDATVTTCTLKTLIGEEEHFFVLASDAITFSSAAGIKKAFTKYAKDFGMSRAALETFNAQDLGAWCADQLFDHEMVSATRERQAAAFTALYNAASEGRLHIHPAFEKLLSEMAVFEYRLESTGTSKGSIPVFEAAKGLHDDHVYSLAWSIFALREIELNPYEIVGLHCDAIGPAAPLCVLNGGSIVPMCADQCKSMTNATSLYQKYKSRAGCAPISFNEFFSLKVTNIGSHTVRR